MGVWDLIRKTACTDRRILQPDDLYKVYLARQAIHLPASSPRMIDDTSTSLHWVIGSYSELKRLADNLRVNAQLQTSFTDAGAGYGRRQDDEPPTSDIRNPRKFRPAERAATRAGTLNPVREDLLDQRSDQSDRTPRRGDRFGPYATFYQQKTLEAHHIVEKSMFHTLGLNTGEFTDERAPCVLVAAELHQQFFSPVVGRLRKAITPGMSHTDAANEMRKIYGIPEDEESDPAPGGLYLPPQMSALKDIAKIIIERVETGCTD